LNYSVTAAERVKDLPATDKRGALVVYKLTLNAGNSSFANVELVQKPDTAAPKPGDSLEGSITQTEYGPRFKKAPQKMGVFGSSGKSPAEQAAITRQGAEQRAALYLIAKAMVKQHLQQDLTREDFKKLCDWFVEDATA
jgi:hypothetical protein